MAEYILNGGKADGYCGGAAVLSRRSGKPLIRPPLPHCTIGRCAVHHRLASLEAAATAEGHERTCPERVDIAVVVAAGQANGNGGLDDLIVQALLAQGVRRYVVAP
ncbi:hypothetical protein LB557_02065 [Mesorhizobium sp. BR115XR7A]|uniref:hypothetical protein n=1 Tax=Mesorhizobium sp. BR115XR7A TaxID=2876645 RepID=UPI001CD0946F|nr:hypothetical protein [Mesorhizobium sp. BR115XR7A]MBZ9904793.1 hypothetical protein [Mesorhizobium sp. BR115XR7A]